MRGIIQKINQAQRIEPMNKIDAYNLDGHLLRVLVTVVETGSLTAAAQRLGVTQGAVSHQLGRLRVILGDALLVKCGRGVVPTARALVLADGARELLRALRAFAENGRFDPLAWKATVTVAANDFQRDLLLPALMARLRHAAPGLCLRVIPSNIPDPALLRTAQCQLIISPRPPDAADVLQRRLLAAEHRVFYDASQRAAPLSLADYLAADHITVVYTPQRATDLDEVLAARGVVRRFRVMVPGFAAMPAFLRGSTLLATAPGPLRSGLLAGLADVAPPLPCPSLPMYLIWHVRDQADAALQWLRSQLIEVAAQIQAVPSSP